MHTMRFNVPLCWALYKQQGVPLPGSPKEKKTDSDSENFVPDKDFSLKLLRTVLI